MNNDELVRNLMRQMEALASTLATLKGEKRTMTFGEYATSYLAAKNRRPSLRASTKRSFENQVVKHLVPTFGHLALDKIDNDAWLTWVTGPCTLTRFFNARKSIIEIMMAAKDEGHIEKLPKFDNPDQDRDVGRALERSEILSIIFHARRPFRFIFYTFWKMGCRPREILQWRYDMISWDEPGKTWINVPAAISKTGRSRGISINPEVSAMLKRRFTWGADSPYVFPKRGNLNAPQTSYQSAWTLACRKAKVKNAMVYDLRRTFVTRAMADNQPPIYVAKHLDSSVKMFEKTYAKKQVLVMEEIVR